MNPVSRRRPLVAVVSAILALALTGCGFVVVLLGACGLLWGVLSSTNEIVPILSADKVTGEFEVSSCRAVGWIGPGNSAFRWSCDGTFAPGGTGSPSAGTELRTVGYDFRPGSRVAAVMVPSQRAAYVAGLPMFVCFLGPLGVLTGVSAMILLVTNRIGWKISFVGFGCAIVCGLVVLLVSIPLAIS